MEEFGLRRLFAGLDFDGGGFMFEAEEEATRIF